MKLLFFVPLLIIAGCNAPTGTRIQKATTGMSGNYTAPPATTGGTVGGGGQTGGVTTPTAPTSGFESCDLSDKYASTEIGAMGICQSTQNENQIKFRPSLANQVARTCLIPTYKDSTGSSTWIGNPQCTFTVKDKEYLGTLYKDRVGFTSYPLNGLIVIKEAAMPYYFACMDAYAKYIRTYCPANPTYSPCVTAANKYRTDLCTVFKSTYSAAYIDIRLK